MENNSNNQSNDDDDNNLFVMSLSDRTIKFCGLLILQIPSFCCTIFM